MPGLNKRSVLNMNSMAFGRDYPMINFLKMAYMYGPGTASDSTKLDANGYGTNNSMGVLTWAFNMPSTANSPGFYVLKWTGDGTVWLNDGVATYTEQAGSINYTRTSNGRYTGVNAYIIINMTGFAGGLTDCSIRTFNNANPITDIKLYMLADETDLLAGKVFRNGWKQTLLGLNPGVIRCLNWTGGSSNPIVRWSDRIPPGYTQYVNNFNTLPYGTSTGTQDQVVTGITGTPVSMRHGEVAVFNIGTNATGGQAAVDISGISNGTNGRVTTSSPHGFTTGMKIIHFINYGCTGTMWQMHYRVATITVFSTTQYDLNINTSSFDTFNHLTFCQAMPHITLNVGSRGAYPVFRFQTEQPFTWFGNVWDAGGKVTCVFDKYLIGDVSVGAGVWRTYPTNATDYTTFNPGCPTEVCVALVNELNAAKQAAHPGSGAINLWLNIQYAGLLSVDPDYDSNENLVLKTIDRVLNGAGGWAGLTASAALLVEFSNETWNNAGGFDAATYLARVGMPRFGTWPGAAGGYADFHSFATVRATAMHQDVAAAYSSQLASNRVIRVMGAHSGSGPVSSGPNNFRVDGTAAILADAWVGGAAPYTKYETIAWAPYYNLSDAQYTANLATFTANWLAAVGAPAKEAVCQTFVDMVDALGSDYGRVYETTVMLPQSATHMIARSRTVIQYEGGYNWPTVQNTSIGGGLTVDQAAFLTAVQSSTGWATSQRACFNAVGTTTGAYHPAIYIQTTDDAPGSGRWGYNRPNFDNYLGGVEGGALNATWTTMSQYNALQESGTAAPAYSLGLPLMLAMRTRIMPKWYPAVPGALWHTLYSHSGSPGSANWNGYTLRVVVPVAVYSVGVPATGTQLRVTMQSHPSAGGVIWDHIYIGHAAAVGDAYDFDGTQVLLLWSGSAGASMAVNTALLSDAVTYAFDKTKPLVISAHFSGAANVAVDSVTGFSRNYKTSVDEAATTNVSSYTTGADLLDGFYQVEVFG